MTRVFDFTELKATKQGKVTPLFLVETLLDHIKNNPGDVQKMAIVTLHQGDRLSFSQTSMNHLELIGLHAAGQSYGVAEMDDLE